MRVRIVSPINGSIDGIDLSKFRIDVVYEMSTSLANYLMASGYAVPVMDEKPALVAPVQEAEDASERAPRNTANERRRTPRAKPR